ncbi:unnamed protein product [Allacma fusca]|uniref:Thioredoxin domain-containing protein n=1 Tax=Allacma fusca TaxID=39272 RepID=A0A8J2KYJ3_9HEXA|nr:unnamed protein product [Allacma fusca]
MATSGEDAKVPAAEPETGSENVIRESDASGTADHEEHSTEPNEAPGSETTAPEHAEHPQLGSSLTKVDDSALIYQKPSEPKPKKSLQTLKEEHRLSLLTFSRPKSRESVPSREKKSQESLHSREKRVSHKKRRSSQSQHENEEEASSKRSSSSIIEIAAMGMGSNEHLNSLVVPSQVSQAGSILSKTYKEKELHVKVRVAEEPSNEEDEDLDDWLDEDEFSDEGDEDDESKRARRGSGKIKKSKSDSKSAISFSTLLKNNKPTDRELAMEIYETLQMKTFADLLIAKAKRPLLLDAYCLGRGIIDPPIPNIRPSYPDKFVVHDENILTYSSFLARLQELEDQNSHSLQQIVLVFTASLVSQKKTWSEDCNLIETAVAWMSRYLDADCNLMYIRTGTHSEWKDPANPFRTDKRLMLKSLPTITVWNTEKRLAGSRLFNLDNIAVLLED